MKRWEYREVIWQPGETMVTTCSDGEEPATKAYPSEQWYKILGKLGGTGWELVSCTSSPMGVHEYYFYFKREFEE